jgi:hypothetical protein
MLKRTFRIYALSLAAGALLLGGVSVAAGAMTLVLPGGLTEKSTAEILRDGDATAKVEQIWWHRGWGWHHRGWGWHRGWYGGWGWHRGWGSHRGWGWGGGEWCYWHPYACRGWYW